MWGAAHPACGGEVTTRETRDQRRISTWYQNLRVLEVLRLFW